MPSPRVLVAPDAFKGTHCEGRRALGLDGVRVASTLHALEAAGAQLARPLLGDARG